MRILVLQIFIEVIGVVCCSDGISYLDSDDAWKIVALILFGGILVMLLLSACLLYKLNKLKRNLEENPLTSSTSNNEVLIPNQCQNKEISNNELNNAELGESLIALDCEDLNLKREFEIDIKNLEIMEIIEKGYFNVVQRGKLTAASPRDWNDQKLDVMVKGALNQQDDTQKSMILEELNVMSEIGKHPNVLALVGFVVNFSDILIVTEKVVENNLLEIVKRCERSMDGFYNELDLNTGNYKIEKPVLAKNTDWFATVDLLSFAYQIANGMKHLASKSYVHRQLALRNVFIAKWNIIRIGDLGLARRHGNNEYYRIMNKEIPLPFHWMAPETFVLHKFTEKSDVWSYGICLWELFTLGKMPYEGVMDVLKFLENGGRLVKPEYCHQEIYDFMLKCWDLNPDNRPTFAKCVQFFENHFEKHNIQILEYIQNLLELTSIYQDRLENWSREDDDERDRV